MTNGAGPHGKAKKKAAKKTKPAETKVSAKRKNWVPDGLAKEATRKGSGGN